ncbi:MAG: hypothetical protein RRB22_13950 [Gammaproteobacteria bacterium]|nr:hypothetical protein [Gammaproteobacteria bacterium]
MNPLKYRLPEQQTDAGGLQPQPAALSAWVAAQPTINAQSTAPLLLALLQRYNRCQLPAATRLRAAIILQPVVDHTIKQLRNYYQNESLPLRSNARAQADLAAQLLDETAFAYKRVVADAVTVDNDMSINLLVAALRLSIDQMGQQLLEAYSQYAPPPPGLWGELHRTYQLAERNGLHTRVLAENACRGEAENPFATVQHGYLRVALLALTTPNHLMPGQAALIYGYLEKWTLGCRMLTKKVTLAETGDIVIDLAGERPPAVATGYARFRPVDGRFLDIRKLQEKLDEISASVDQKGQGGLPLTIAERLRRDLLTRLRAAWQGRSERRDQREDDRDSTVSLCLGLDACHHFMGGKIDFTPEKHEIHYHRPQEVGNGLQLVPTDDGWASAALGSTGPLGTDTTRLSHFGGTVDVWDAIHDTEIQARDRREASMANFRVEAWLCINQSAGGMALRRLPETQSRTRVGALVAFPTDPQHQHWTVGALRWLQDDPGSDFDIGVMTLTDTAIPIAVRAIGGAGSGGEYFRSLLIEGPENPTADHTPDSLLVPASIYDLGTQLVLNRQTTLEYVRLTRLVETTSSFSRFEFRHIEVPPAEQAKISAIRQTQD